jgi:hypothetical protein
VSTAQILDNLVNNTSQTQQHEVSLPTLAKTALTVYGAKKVADLLFKSSFRPIKDIYKSIYLSRLLTKATTKEDQVAALYGLLNICASSLVTMPDYQDIGTKIISIIKSDKFDNAREILS